MAVDDPWAIDGVPLSALEWRRAMSGLLMHDTDPVSARAGVLSGCGVTVASLTATVGAGQLVVTPQVGSNGSYIDSLTSTALAVTAQDATHARIDRVVARIYDNSVDGSGQNKAAVEIITGTPSASPVAPALPTGALELAQLQVPKVGSPIVVVDRRVWTVTNGGVLTVPDLTALNAITPPRPGIKAVIGSGGSVVEFVWDGTVWRLSGTPTFASTGARDALVPSPLPGDQCNVGADSYRCVSAGQWRLWSRPLTTWAPAITGITAGLAVGGATRYCVTGGVLHAEIYLNCTAGLAGTNLTVALPLAIATEAWTAIGDAVLNPNGTRYWGRCLRGATNTEIWIKSLGTAGQPVDITAAVPATWSARSQAVAATLSAPLA